MPRRESVKLTMTVAEAAQALGIGLNNTYGLVSCGKLKAVRIGRKLLIPQHELRDFLDREVSRENVQ